MFSKIKGLFVKEKPTPIPTNPKDLVDLLCGYAQPLTIYKLFIGTGKKQEKEYYKYKSKIENTLLQYRGCNEGAAHLITQQALVMGCHTFSATALRLIYCAS